MFVLHVVAGATDHNLVTGLHFDIVGGTADDQVGHGADNFDVVAGAAHHDHLSVGLDDSLFRTARNHDGVTGLGFNGHLGPFNLDVDITIVGEYPKIGPHRERMRKSVASMLGLQSRCVNIKATTTEKLGFAGRQEGLAAQATASIGLPAK